MIGRRVRSVWGDIGEVRRWEPLSSGMTDTLVRFEDGKECWFSSTDLRPVDGRGALPDRTDARRHANARTMVLLDAIIERHVREFSQPWPGCEFAKVLVGNGFVAARDTVKTRLG